MGSLLDLGSSIGNFLGNAGQSIGQDFSNLGTNVQQNVVNPVHQAITQDFNNWKTTQANNQRQIGQQNQNFNNSIGQGWNNFTNHQFVPGGMTFNQIGQDIVHNPGSYNVINNAVNSPYFQNKVYNPISQGVQQFTKPGLMNKASGAASVAQGVWGAMPSGMIWNEGYGAAGGALRSIRTGQPLAQSVIQGLNQPTDIGGSGLGIKNPLAAAGVDLLAGNPKALLTKGPKLLGAVKNMMSVTPTIDEAAAKAIPQLLDKYNNNNFTIADQQAADSLIKQYNPIPKSVLKTIPPEQQTYRQLNELAGQLTPNQDYMYRQLPGMNAFAGKGQTGKVTGLAGTTDNAATKLPQTVANPQEQPRGFTTSVQNSNEVSPQTKVGVTSAYTPKANQVLINSSTKLVGGGLMKATNQVLTNLAQKGVPVTDQGVSDAIAVAKALDAKGKFDQASTIYDSLSGKLTEAGRSVQAASLLSSRTPQGLHFSAIAALKKAGVEATPAIQSTIKGFVNDIKQTAGGSDARTMATQKLINFVNNNLPRSKTDAALGIWRTGLLTGPETVAKVLVSHGITTPFEMAAQIPSALADRVMSLVTGKRGMTATFKGAGSGAVTGIKAMGTKMKSGVDVPNTGGFESDFGSATHQTAYEKFIGNLHGSLAKPAYGMRYKVSLNDQALTEAGNQGLSGAAKDKFVRDFVSNPPDKAINTANNDAQIATNQQRTSAGQAASAISNMKMGPVPVGKILAPFTRIPAAIGVNGLWNYTPFGIGKEVISAVTSGKFDQRVMAQAFGRSATGTTVAALGALLGAHGLMTLKAPSDPKERALWEAQGKQANSIKMGDKWISLNAMGPVGLVLGMGGAFGQAAQKNGGDIPASLASALASGGRLLLDQPYLKGIAGVGQALNDPTRYGQTLFDNTVGSVVPAVSSQVARGSDTVQRMYPKGLADQFKGEIPGLRSQLPVQRDLYGNPVAGANPGGTVAGGAVGTVNPFYPSQAKSDPVTSELQRLYDSIGSTGSPNVAQIPANQTVYGQKVKLNNQQISDFTAQVWTTSQTGVIYYHV